MLPQYLYTLANSCKCLPILDKIHISCIINITVTKGRIHFRRKPLTKCVTWASRKTAQTVTKKGGEVALNI